MTDVEFIAAYIKLGHALQTGVAHDQQQGSTDGTPKHLRVGLNCVMSDLGALTRLLVAKGVITQDEYYTAVLEGLRLEVEKYEQRLEERFGTKITLA
jgi:hypothetical protein